MMPEDLPHCLCGKAAWRGRGGSFGGLSQSNFKCGNCDRFATQVSGRGGNILLMVREPSAGISDKVADWLNGSILALWRDNAGKFDADMKATEALLDSKEHAVRDAAAKKLADNKHGGPLAMKVFPLLNGGISEGYKGPLLHALLQTVGQWRLGWRPRIQDPDAPEGEYKSIPDPESPDRGLILKRLAETGKYEVGRHATAILEKIETFKAEKRSCDFSTGSPDAPIPPKVPGEEVAVWILKYGETEWIWEHIDPDRTQDLVIPPDPIRVYHDVIYGEIFEGAGLGSVPRAEIPNGYYGDKFKNEPWYELQFDGFTLTIGPRKRVISITLQHKQPFDVSSLCALGRRDVTTYTADGGWNSDQKMAATANLHAWSKEKAIEYLQAMMKIVRS